MSLSTYINRYVLPTFNKKKKTIIENLIKSNEYSFSGHQWRPLHLFIQHYPNGELTSTETEVLMEMNIN